MTLKPTRAVVTAAIAAFAVSSSFVTDANARAKTYTFGKTGNWKVMAVVDASKNNQFSHCSAQVRYKSGMEVFLLGYRSGNWSIQFYRKDWPKRAKSRFPVTLKVDGRTVMQTQGRFGGRSAFVDLGKSADRVRAIMRGRVMAIVSETGTSRFKLTGTFRAAQMVARCWQKYTRIAARRNDGAFGAAPRKRNDGAFGAPAPRNDGAFGGNGNRDTARSTPRRSERNTNKLTRDETLGLARRYLRASQRDYAILGRGQHVFKHFPVNWKYGNGRVGGMMILRRSKLNAISGLESLLTDQRKWCKGENEFKYKPTSGQRGSRVSRARGTCRSNNGGTVVYDYSAAELSNRRVMLIVETINSGRSTGGNVERRRRDDNDNARSERRSDASGGGINGGGGLAAPRWRSKGANDI